MWEKEETRCRLFIDDNTVVEKIYLGDSESTISTQKEERRLRARESERILEIVSMNAQAIGMRVNKAKTQLLNINCSINFNLSSYIIVDGEEIRSTDKLKILGFTFGSRPNVNEHLRTIKQKYGARSWVLRNLKQSGLPESHLVQVYTALIRPVLEYASVSYHHLLTNEQSEEIERLQRISLKTIYGNWFSYSDCLEKSKLKEMKDRRQDIFRKFAEKNIEGRYQEKWFPVNPEPTYNLRRSEKYVIPRTKNNRLKNSPVYQMRVLMNNCEH